MRCTEQKQERHQGRHRREEKAQKLVASESAAADLSEEELAEPLKTKAKTKKRKGEAAAALAAEKEDEEEAEPPAKRKRGGAR